MSSYSWDSATNEYVTALIATGRSPRTIRVHRHYLRRLKRTIPTPSKLTIASIECSLAAPRWAPETRKSARSVVRGFCRWAHGRGILDDDPSRMLPTITVPPPTPRPAPERVIENSLRFATDRERWMIKLGAQCGLRCIEIATVHTDHLDDPVRVVLPSGVSRVVPILRVLGKGGEVRRVPVLDDELHRAIRDAEGWLFPGRIDGHLSAPYVSKLLSRALEGTYTGHMLRHRMATRSYAETKDLLAVSLMLGHSRVETTQRYVQSPFDDLVAVAAAAL